jgi:hypothetical protein
MSRTKFNLGICRRIFFWTACPFSVGSCFQSRLPAICQGSQSDSLSAPRPRVVPFDVQVIPSCFDSRSFSARSPAGTASPAQAASLALRVGVGCQPWFYRRLRGLQLSPVMRGGIQLGQVLNPTRDTKRFDTLPRPLGTSRPQRLQPILVRLDLKWPLLRSMPLAHSPSAHRMPLLSSTASRSTPQSSAPTSAGPSPVSSPPLSVSDNKTGTAPAECHPPPHS